MVVVNGEVVGVLLLVLVLGDLTQLASAVVDREA